MSLPSPTYSMYTYYGNSEKDKIVLLFFSYL